MIPASLLKSYSIVTLDLNNTLMNQISGICRASKGRLTPADFAEWDVDLSDKMGMSKDQYLSWAWANPYTELLSPAFDGAAQAVQAMKRNGATIWIATASHLSELEIKWWLNWHCVPFDKVIRTNDKRGLGDVLIDDSPVTCKTFYDEGLPILRFDLAWNRHLTHIQGVSWL